MENKTTIEREQVKPNHVKSELESKIDVEVNQATGEKLYPYQIPEAQGDLADRANIEIDQELQEQIWRIQQKARQADAEKIESEEQ